MQRISEFIKIKTEKFNQKCLKNNATLSRHMCWIFGKPICVCSKQNRPSFMMQYFFRNFLSSMKFHDWLGFFFWYFADRTSQYIYFNINQLDALNFIMSLFHASTCFEHTYASSGGQNCTIQPLVTSHL